GNAVADTHGIVHVLVHVNDREFRALYRVNRRVHHGSGMEVAQQKRFLLLGIRSCLVSDLAEQRSAWDEQAEKQCQPNKRSRFHQDSSDTSAWLSFAGNFISPILCWLEVRINFTADHQAIGAFERNAIQPIHPQFYGVLTSRGEGMRDRASF